MIRLAVFQNGHILLSLGLLLGAHAAGAAEPVWIDGRDLPLEGRAFAETEKYYDRLPAVASNRVTKNVWRLQRNSAGMQFRFRTDSTTLRLRWSLTDPKLASGKMSPTGKSGIDVYRHTEDGDWLHVRPGLLSAAVDKPGELHTLETGWDPSDECVVYLPTYNGVESFAVGLDAGKRILPARPRASGVTKPVVFYGTSITQGGCVSRAGLAFVSGAGRLADVPVVNLGFSGAGQMEDAMCDFVGDVDASCYVLDTVWNMDMGMMKERWERFARKLHARRPDVPIVFAEPCCSPDCAYPSAARERADFVRGVFTKLRQEDPAHWRNLTLLPSEGQLPSDGEGTIDGIHPNDAGMNRMARVFARAIEDAFASNARPWNPTNEWPFAIVRSYGALAENANFTREMLAAQIRHPGLVDEVWDDGAALMQSDEACSRAIAASDDLAAQLGRFGIARAYQQGFTFGHEGNLRDYPGFTDADWTVASDGKVRKNVFCPLSPVAEKANRRQIERVLKQMKPVSYWPDDDLRYSKYGDTICFCARCLAAFGAKTGRTWTREALVKALYGVPGDKAVREAWIAFNAENLGRFARIYREAVDKYLPSCRLGIQLVQSYADYNGRDFRPLIEALAGPERKKVGIRPGACFYEDRKPRDMFRKALYVMNESARTKSYGLIGQICYEAENWPHVAAAKNPVSQMVECSLALAAGCDSLALYWGADRDRLHREEPATHANYFETFAKWKPFLLAVRDACRGTDPCGLAEFRGSDEKATGDWCWRDDATEIRLMENALPISVPDARSEAHWLSARRVAALATNDLSVLFARTVLADGGAVRALRGRFPGHPAFERIVLPSENDACAVTRTEFGGTVVVARDLAVKHLWTGPDRAAILDALDAAIPGRTAARILTGGFCVTPIVRTDAAGRVKGVYVLNASPGETVPLKLSVRRPAGTRVRVRTVDGVRSPLEKRRKGEELEIVIPPLAGWRPVLIEFQK